MHAYIKVVCLFLKSFCRELALFLLIQQQLQFEIAYIKTLLVKLKDFTQTAGTKYINTLQMPRINVNQTWNLVNSDFLYIWIQPVLGDGRHLWFTCGQSCFSWKLPWYLEAITNLFHLKLGQSLAISKTTTDQQMILIQVSHKDQDILHIIVIGCICYNLHFAQINTCVLWFPKTKNMQLNDNLLWFYANYNKIGTKNHNNLRDIIYMMIVG